VLGSGKTTLLRDLAPAGGRPFLAFMAIVAVNIVLGFVLSVLVFGDYWAALAKGRVLAEDDATAVGISTTTAQRWKSVFRGWPHGGRICFGPRKRRDLPTCGTLPARQGRLPAL
jgi:hypothetical protein